MRCIHMPVLMGTPRPLEAPAPSRKPLAAMPGQRQRHGDEEAMDADKRIGSCALTGAGAGQPANAGKALPDLTQRRISA